MEERFSHKPQQHLCFIQLAHYRLALKQSTSHRSLSLAYRFDAFPGAQDFATWSQWGFLKPKRNRTDVKWEPSHSATFPWLFPQVLLWIVNVSEVVWVSLSWNLSIYFTLPGSVFFFLSPSTCLPHPGSISDCVFFWSHNWALLWQEGLKMLYGKHNKYRPTSFHMGDVLSCQSAFLSHQSLFRYRIF